MKWIFEVPKNSGIFISIINVKETEIQISRIITRRNIIILT